MLHINTFICICFHLHHTQALRCKINITGLATELVIDQNLTQEEHY